jgi:hypothetical protein
VDESREIQPGVLAEFEERRRRHAWCGAERNEKIERASSTTDVDKEKEVVGGMTSARSPDRDSTRASDRIRPRLGKLRAPLALSPAASHKCSPLLPPTRCLHPPLSPSKRSTRLVSVPSDSWLYHARCAAFRAWMRARRRLTAGQHARALLGRGRHRDMHERCVCTSIHAHVHGLSSAPSSAS